MLSVEVAVIVAGAAVAMSLTALLLSLRKDRRRGEPEGADAESDVTVTVDVGGKRTTYQHLSRDTYRKLAATLSNAGEGRPADGARHEPTPKRPAKT